jgi:O-antigen/teichoic acid export membrane protein
MSTKRNFAFNFILTGSNLLFPLLTFPYLSRILGAEGLGICNFIMSYGQNFIIISALGIPVYGIREIAKVGNDKAKRSKLFFELLSIHFIFTLFLLAFYIASVFTFADFSNYRELALLGGTLILFNVFSIEWLFTGINNFKYITIRSLFIRCFSVAAIFLFVRTKDDFNIYFLILVCTAFCTAFVNVMYARAFISRVRNFSSKGIYTHVKPMFVLGIYMVLTNIYSVLPTTLLGFLSTKLAVGYFYGANKIIRMVISVFTSLVTVMVPRLNQVLEEKGKNEYILLINKSLNIVITFGIPITFLVFLLARPVVMFLAGENFINSIVLIQIMAPVILIVAFAQVFVLLVLSVNRKDNYMVLLSIIGMAISLIINLIFIPSFAEKATAISQLAAELLVTIVSFLLARKVLDFVFPVKKLLLNLVLVIPFYVITYFSYKFLDNNFLVMAISGIVCGMYFLFYQLFIIKDQFIHELLKPYLLRLSNNRLH